MPQLSGNLSLVFSFGLFVGFVFLWPSLEAYPNFCTHRCNLTALLCALRGQTSVPEMDKTEGTSVWMSISKFCML